MDAQTWLWIVLIVVLLLCGLPMLRMGRRGGWRVACAEYAIRAGAAPYRTPRARSTSAITSNDCENWSASA